MRTVKLVACVTALSLCSFTAWAQGTKPGATPPPADLEPGVNTSATPPSSAEPESTAAPSPAPKPAPTAAKRSPASSAQNPPSGAAGQPGGSATRPSSAAASGPNTVPGAAPSPGNTATEPSSNAGATASAAPPKGGKAATAATAAKGSGKAHDSLELDTTQITGNRELPKVLYIVPWKRSDLGDLVGKPVNSLLDEVLTPVDRDVFKRQNRYYDALKPDDAGKAGAASDPAK